MTKEDSKVPGTPDAGLPPKGPLLALVELGDDSGWDVGSVEKDAQGRLAHVTFKHSVTGETTTLSVPDAMVKPNKPVTPRDKRRRKPARWAR